MSIDTTQVEWALATLAARVREAEAERDALRGRLAAAQEECEHWREGWWSAMQDMSRERQRAVDATRLWADARDNLRAVAATVGVVDVPDEGITDAILAAVAEECERLRGLVVAATQRGDLLADRAERRAAAEREACAVICDEMHHSAPVRIEDHCDEAAAAIWARGA